MNAIALLIALPLCVGASDDSVSLMQKMVNVNEVSNNFRVHKGMQCVGEADDLLRKFVGTAEECQAKCTELGVDCTGFVRITDKSSFAGTCSFRSGKLSTPATSEGDKRDCFERVAPGSEAAGVQEVRKIDAASSVMLARRGWEDLTITEEDVKGKVFMQITGMQCIGEEMDILRNFAGTAQECQAKCLSLGDQCTGFVRINTNSHFSGKCFFRSGRILAPTYAKEDERDCYRRMLFKDVEKNLEWDVVPEPEKDEEEVHMPEMRKLSARKVSARATQVEAAPAAKAQVEAKAKTSIWSDWAWAHPKSRDAVKKQVEAAKAAEDAKKKSAEDALVEESAPAAETEKQDDAPMSGPAHITQAAPLKEDGKKEKIQDLIRDAKTMVNKTRNLMDKITSRAAMTDQWIPSLAAVQSRGRRAHVSTEDANSNWQVDMVETETADHRTEEASAKDSTPTWRSAPKEVDQEWGAKTENDGMNSGSATGTEVDQAADDMFAPSAQIEVA